MMMTPMRRRAALERRPGEGIVWRPPWASPPEDG